VPDGGLKILQASSVGFAGRILDRPRVGYASRRNADCSSVLTMAARSRTCTVCFLAAASVLSAATIAAAVATVTVGELAHPGRCEGTPVTVRVGVDGAQGGDVATLVRHGSADN